MCRLAALFSEGCCIKVAVAVDRGWFSEVSEEFFGGSAANPLPSGGYRPYQLDRRSVSENVGWISSHRVPADSRPSPVCPSGIGIPGPQR